ncbi:MAG: glycosyltransferase family 4 protein [Phycisphaeraceae bacterium]
MGSLTFSDDVAGRILPQGAAQAGTKVSPRKVCIVSRAPFIGGAELAAERLGIGLRNEGHEVFFILGQHGDVQDRLEASGLRCLVFPVQHTDMRRFWRYFGARATLRNLFKREKPDVIHSNDLPSAQIFFDAARGLGITRVCHHRYIYDGPAIDWFNKYGAERHLFVSRALMNDLCERSEILSSANKAVVYDGLELPARPLVPDRLTAREELGLPLNQTITLFAGQIIERKGVAELLRAWAILRGQGREIGELVIVGDDSAGKGAYREKMQALAGDLRIRPRFAGFQKNVNRWLTAADLAVVPSHVEPLGNATLEAMAAGLPVIGSRIGGIPEMIVHEETGLLTPAKAPVTLAEATGRLIEDVALRQSLGAAARLRCETLFSLKAHTSAVLRQYEMASQRGSARQAA